MDEKLKQLKEAELRVEIINEELYDALLSLINLRFEVSREKEKHEEV